MSMTAREADANRAFPTQTVHFSGKRDAHASDPEISTPSVLISGLREEAAEFPDFCTGRGVVGTSGRVEPGRQDRDDARQLHPPGPD
jgi:hypothetical protein